MNLILTVVSLGICVSSTSFSAELPESLFGVVESKNDPNILERYISLIRGDFGRMDPGFEPLDHAAAFVLFVHQDINITVDQVVTEFERAYDFHVIRRFDRGLVETLFNRLISMTQLPDAVHKIIVEVRGNHKTSNAVRLAAERIHDLISASPLLISPLDNRFDSLRRIINLIGLWNDFCLPSASHPDEAFVFNESLQLWTMSPQVKAALVRRLALASVTEYENQYN